MDLHCNWCKVDMVSLASGITWCPNCGKISSIYAPTMVPELSKMIFEAKKSCGEKFPGKIKVSFGPPNEESPKFRVIE